VKNAYGVILSPFSLVILSEAKNIAMAILDGKARSFASLRMTPKAKGSK